MFLLAISETTDGLLLYRWKAFPEQNINMQKYFNNTLLSLNLQIFTDEDLIFANCEYTGCPIKKVSIKKLLFGAAQGLNLQFLNLFRFSISVSYVWCII